MLKKHLLYSFFILLVIPILHWFIVPQLDKIPSDLNYSSNLFSIDNLYDEQKHQYSGDILSVTKFNFKAVKEVENGLIIQNEFESKKPSGEKIFAVTRMYGIDPYSGKHNSAIGDKSRNGHLFAPRGIQQGESFTYWHVNYDAPALMQFNGVETIAGLTVYKYSCNYKADQSYDLKHLPGVPNDRGVEIDIYLETWIDPLTGWLIKYEDHATAWFYDKKTTKRTHPWNKFHNEFTYSSVLQQVEIAKNKQLIHLLISSYLPLLLVFIVLIIVVSNSSFIKLNKLKPKYTLVLISSIGISLSIWLLSFLLSKEKETVNIRFENESTKILSYINEEFNRTQQALRNLTLEFDETENSIPDRKWFKQKAIFLIAQNSSLKSLAYLPYIRHSEREKFESIAKNEGINKFEFKERNEHNRLIKAEPRDFYIPMYLIEPLDRNQLVLGFDYASNKERLISLNNARISRNYALTAPIKLVQDNSKGVVLFYPVYIKSNFYEKDIAGFFAGIYAIDELINSAVNSHDVNRKIRLSIKDVTENAELSVFSNVKSHTDNDLVITKHFPVFDRKWAFTFYLDNVQSSKIPWIIFSICIILSLLSAYLIFRIQNDNSKELAIQIEKLEKTRTFLLDAQEIGKIGSWENNLDTSEIRASKEFFDILGIPPREPGIIGVDEYNSFIYPDDLELVKNSVELAIQNNESYSMEFRVVQANGSIITVWTKGRPSFDANGNPKRIIGTILDITEKKKIEENLIKAKQQLEESSRLKESFLTNMSHEIRTPLNAIIGFTDLLLKRNLPGKEHDYLKTIKYSGEMLLSLINDILDISKIESGLLTFEKIPFRIRRNFEGLRDMFAQKAKEKNLDLTFHWDENIPQTIAGDPTRLNQVLTNLIGNAIKFTEKGKVEVYAKTINASKKTHTIEFEVKDSGIGIPKEKLSLVFERFRQAENRTARKFGGTGLGLNIAKQLIENQGGSIALTSKVGVGTSVKFTLEFDATKQSAIEEDTISSVVNINKISGIRILVAEDNPINIKYMQSLFSDYSFYVDYALNGKIVLEMLKQNQYDIILMDIEMPEMDGYEATRIIREKLKSNIPILAVSAHSMEGDRKKAMSNGMNEFVSKPIHTDILFEKILELTGPISNDRLKFPKQKTMVDLDFLIDSVKGRAETILEIFEVFLTDVPKDLSIIENAIELLDFSTIKRKSHNLKSTITLFGITELIETIVEMEELAKEQKSIETIKELYSVLKSKCNQAVEEVKREKSKYETQQ